MPDDWLVMSIEEWHAQGQALFGADPNKWRFVCPACGHVQTREDWLATKVNPRQIDILLGFTCIGRWLNPLNMATAFEPSKGSGCDYAGHLKPNISPLTVILSPDNERPTFGWDQS